MSFLAPLFLAGVAALALPVLFHLIRRKTRDQFPFSSLIFLRMSPPRLTRRSRLEDLLLLLLRCLVLALLALAFARPFFKQPQTLPRLAGTGRRVVLLLDTSASMRRSGVWEAAQARVASVVRGLGPGDSLAVHAVDRQIRLVTTFDQWNAQPAGAREGYVTGRIKTLSPGWSSTDLGAALVRAAEELADPTTHKSDELLQVVLVSDLQEGARLQALGSYEWPKSVRLIVDAVKSKSEGNAGLQWVPGAPGAATSGDPLEGVRIRVVNSGDARKESFSVAWTKPGTQEPLGTPIPVYVPPGQSRIVTLPLPGTNAPAGVTQVMLIGDDEAFDNHIAVIPPEPTPVRIAYFGADASEASTPEGVSRQPLFFLRRALEGNKRQRVEITARTPDAAGALSVDQLPEVNVVTSALSASQASALRERMTAGATVLLVLSPEDSASNLSALSGVPGIAVEEARVRGDVLLGDLDFKHPFLLPFADPRFSDFTHIHFWKYRKVDATALTGARVPARFDTGDPAVIELGIGRGRLVVFASGWQPSDSQLAVSTKFVPLLQSILESAGVGVEQPSSYVIDDPVPLDAREAAAVQIRTPQGQVIPVAKGSASFSETAEPGVYFVESAGTGGSGGKVLRRFAVNLDPQESRTVPMPLETLERFGAPSIATTDRSAVEPSTAAVGALAAIEAESQQKLWKWSLTLALALAVLETGLAAFGTRRSIASAGAPAESSLVSP
jgi:hypothetical protein